MITMSKSKLKAHMLRVFREIEASGETLVVTDRSVPVLKITPIKDKEESVESLFAPFRGKVIFHEDMNLPTVDEWGDI